MNDYIPIGWASTSQNTNGTITMYTQSEVVERERRLLERIDQLEKQIEEMRRVGGAEELPGFFIGR